MWVTKLVVAGRNQFPGRKAPGTMGRTMSWVSSPAAAIGLPIPPTVGLALVSRIRNNVLREIEEPLPHMAWLLLNVKGHPSHRLETQYQQDEC